MLELEALYIDVKTCTYLITDIYDYFGAQNFIYYYSMYGNDTRGY